MNEAARGFACAESESWWRAYFGFREARKANAQCLSPVDALGVLYSVLHGTVWHPHAGER